MALGNNLKKPAVKKPENAVVEEEANVLHEEVPVSLDFDDDPFLEDDDDQEKHVEATSLYCVFKAGREEYGLPISLVKEVVKTGKIAPVPQTPDYILGMANIRGNIYAVIDIETYFGIQQGELSLKPYLLVLRNEDFKVALQIPEVSNTLAVADSQVESITSAVLRSVEKREFLQGLVKKDKRMIILLNILELISDPAFATGRNK